MSDIRSIAPEEFELREEEPLWSESSSDSEAEDDFDAINRLNDNSMEKLEGVVGARKQTKWWGVHDLDIVIISQFKSQ